MIMTTGESIALEIQFDLTVELLPRVKLGSWYGYCKNLKKTVKTGQTRTWERKENTRAGRMLSKSYTSPKLLIGGNPQEGTWWHCKKHTGKRKFALKGLKKKHNGSDTRNATLAIRVLTKVIQRLKIKIQ
ncbi:hypothetical protein Tco_0505365 [Tanacetum coccineum]